MWAEDMRLKNDYPQWGCKSCYYARTCTDSIKWILCMDYSQHDWNEKDRKDKENGTTYQKRYTGN